MKLIMQKKKKKSRQKFIPSVSSHTHTHTHSHPPPLNTQMEKELKRSMWILQSLGTRTDTLIQHKHPKAVSDCIIHSQL